MIGRVVTLLVAASAALGEDVPFEKRLKELAAAHPQAVELSTMGKSRQGRDLHVARVGEKGDRQALLIVAGINGMHRVGTDVAVELVGKLAGSDAVKSTTVFIVPCLNPDTYAWHLDKGHPKTDWNRTIVPLDGDRDARTNEDPAEDLNGDGVITSMRIKNPKPGSGLRAEYCIDPENPKLLKKPDAAKGEAAEYAILVEGTDNDGDGKFNEDGVGGAGGGVDLDGNFPYRWPEQWTDGAGRFPLCEPEARALVEWVLKHEDIGAMLVYGPGDTLVNVPQAGKFDRTNEVPLGIEEGDKAAYEMVSKLFKEATNQTGAGTAEMAGSFWGWAYSQFGVFAFETPVWVRPDLVKKPEAKKDEEKPEGDKPEAEKKPEEAAPDPASMTPEQMRARIESATPTERRRMMEEFQSMPAAERERLMQQFGGGRRGGGGGGPTAGQPVIVTTQPVPAGTGGGRPGGGGGQGGGGRRGGGLGRGGEAPAGGAAADAGKKPGEPSGDDAKWLKYDEERVNAGDASGFVDWKTFSHPQLGEVEIGGFVPGFKMNPPESETERLATEQATFIEGLCGRLPKVVAEPIVVERAGEQLWRISLRATNSGSLPTMAAIGVKARRGLPTILAIDVPLERLAAGEKLVRSWSLPAHGGKAEAEWMVMGEAGSTVNVEIRPSVGEKIVVPVKLVEVGR